LVRDPTPDRNLRRTSWIFLHCPSVTRLPTISEAV
jgi:hypothetical protein